MQNTILARDLTWEIALHFDRQVPFAGQEVFFVGDMDKHRDSTPDSV
jgi:hypothetical protein